MPSLAPMTPARSAFNRALMSPRDSGVGTGPVHTWPEAPCGSSSRAGPEVVVGAGAKASIVAGVLLVMSGVNQQARPRALTFVKAPASAAP